MSKRPGMLDLRSHSHNSATSSSSKPLRSPRMHIAGDVPPELSPLDAFAMQSRLLARQLQDSTKDGNRLSRLPPLTTESPLVVQGRSDYFRSLSHDSSSDVAEYPELEAPGLGLRTEVEDGFSPEERPKSMHPRLGGMPQSTQRDAPPLPLPGQDSPRGRPFEPISEDTDFLSSQRQRSPSPMRSDTQSTSEQHSGTVSRPRDNSLPLRSPIPDAPPRESFDIPNQSFEDLGLAPPRTFYPKRSSSIMSSPLVPQEDDNSSTMAGSFHSLPPRKLSSGSSAFANPLYSPAAGSFKRSPSVASDSSFLPRPSFNFSRPLSRAGTPTLDLPSRQASSDSQPSFILADDSAHTPVSMHSEAFLDQQQDDSKNSRSYTYSKFTLPRGKALQREGASDSELAALSQWEQPTMPSSSAHRYPGGAPPSPPTRPSSSSARAALDDTASLASSLTRPSFETGKKSVESSRLGPMGHPSPNPSSASNDSPGLSEEACRGRTLASPHQNPVSRGRTPASTSTSDTASTIRPPPTARSTGLSVSDMSVEDHLNKGIECHQNGSLNESTYHLRHAARGNDPVGMLLYALACRHGWGMRPNQKEGVEWLRRAAEFASEEIADDEDQVKEGRRVDILGMKSHKAQFALSIYELGVSHMNGWGIEQDKSLALRCFEIAGTWGDVDALAEAGFCYAQGIGCKKNLKKSAKFYRMAEAKGMSMVGNSWIHKSKYNEDDKTSSPKKDKKKSRSKSRTRTMFGLKSGGERAH